MSRCRPGPDNSLLGVEAELAENQRHNDFRTRPNLVATHHHQNVVFR
jgi:hypothetical protein